MKILITEEQFNKLDKIKIDGYYIYPNFDNIEANKEIGLNIIKDKINKFNSSEDLLRKGGFDTFELNLYAFGFVDESIKEISPKQLKIKWREDLENVYYEIKQSNLSKLKWSQKINLTEPIDVIFNGKYFILDDGHHRYVAAKTLNKILNVNLIIETNPIKYISNLDYDNFVRDMFKKYNKKNKNLTNELIKNGYDGIITLYDDDTTGEIIIFNKEKSVINEAKENNINFEDKIKFVRGLSDEYKQFALNHKKEYSYVGSGFINGLSLDSELIDKIKEKNLKDGFDMGVDKNGYFIHTHRARSKSHPKPSDITVKEINFVDSTG